MRLSTQAGLSGAVPAPPSGFMTTVESDSCEPSLPRVRSWNPCLASLAHGVGHSRRSFT